MDTYSLVKLAHVALGVGAFASYWTAGLARKGSPLHRAAGKVFLGAMCGIVASGAVFVVQRLATGQPVAAAFLAYLVVLTGTAMWRSWRAPRDKRDWRRYVGRTYRALAAANIAFGGLSLVLGLNYSVRLLTMFSVVGLLAGTTMFGFARRPPPANPRWWMVEHGSAMIANGVATHIAFLSIGLPKLMPSLSGPTLQTIAWMGPIVLATFANVWLRRRYGSTVAKGAPSQTSPSVSHPSPVPRLNTTSESSTSPAAIAGSFATRS